jgi:hypothetical protein
MNVSQNVTESGTFLPIATAVYEFIPPTTNITYCKQIGVEIVSATESGTSISPPYYNYAEKLLKETANWPSYPDKCTSMLNCTIFDYNGTISEPVFFKFRVKSMYPGGIYHLSPNVTF